MILIVLFFTCSCGIIEDINNFIQYEEKYYFLFATNLSEDNVWFLTTEDKDKLRLKRNHDDEINPTGPPFDSMFDTITLDNYTICFTLVEPNSTRAVYCVPDVSWKMAFPSGSIIVRAWKDKTIQSFGGWESFLKDKGQNCLSDAEIVIPLNHIDGMVHYITYPPQTSPIPNQRPSSRL